jgi:4-amino-4-deoxy-L-arabinose transferase-like glycosyltransferase
MLQSDRRTLALILLLGLALRLLYVGAPYVDAHAWRQLDTAAMARNFYETSFVPFDPQVDWGGRRGYLEAEFPLVPAIIALLYFVTGVRDVVGRAVIIAFSLGLIWAVHRLARALDGRASAAAAAAFLVAVSPAMVFFGRIVIPDTPMVFFMTLALAGFVEFARTDSRRWLWLGTASLTLACLVKLPAVFVGPAILAALLQARGVKTLRDPRVWIAGAIPLALTAAWYWHAHVVFERTGLTMGILGVQAKTYPAIVSPGPWPAMYSKWSTGALLSDPDFYQRMLMRFYHFLLMPAGLVCAVLGAAIWRGWGRLTLAVWLAASLVFFFIAGEVERVHEYYQLPFVAIGAVYFGAIAWPLFDAEERRRWFPGAPGQAGFAVVLTLLALLSFYGSSVTQSFFQPRDQAVRMRNIGAALQSVTEANDLAIVVDDYGIQSPILLYFAHLKGWSFDPTDVSPQVIGSLRGLGARYFLTTQWNEFKAARPDTAAVLETMGEVAIPGAPRNTMLLDLRATR